MESQFDQICESLGVMRNTTKMFYPRNLKLSEKFLQAFKEEVGRQKRIFNETSGGKSFQPQGERILKALRFHLHEFNKAKPEEKPITEAPKEVHAPAKGYTIKSLNHPTNKYQVVKTGTSVQVHAAPTVEDARSWIRNRQGINSLRNQRDSMRVFRER